MIKKTVFLTLLLSLTIGPAATEDYILKGATLVQVAPALEKLENSYIVVNGDRISAVGTGNWPSEFNNLPSIDISGRFVTPGLIDSHVHLSSHPGIPYEDTAEFNALLSDYFEQSLKSYLYYGYTTVIDLNANLHHLDRLKQSEIRPNIYDCSAAAPVANGYPMVFQPPEIRFKARPNFIFNEEQRSQLPSDIDLTNHTANAVVKRVKDSGAVCFKTFYETGFRPDLNWPVPNDDLLRELRLLTKQAGLPLLVHANRESAQKAVMAHDVDILVHGMWHWNPIDGKRSYEPGDSAFDLIEQMAKMGIKYMPTLQVLGGEAALFDKEFTAQPELGDVLPPSLVKWYKTKEARWYAHTILRDNAPSDEKLAAVHKENLERLNQSARLAKHYHAHGGTLLFGSDTPSDQTYGNPPGLNGFWEMEHWANADIPLAAILKAATWDNAIAFNIQDEVGSVAVGKLADFAIFDQDPTESVEAYGAVSAVVSRGRLMERDTLNARSVN